MNRWSPVILTLDDGILDFLMINQNLVHSTFLFVFCLHLVLIRVMEMVFVKNQSVLVFLVGLVKIVLLEYVNQFVLEMDFGMNFLENVLVSTVGKEHGATSKKKSVQNASMENASMASAFVTKVLMVTAVNSSNVQLIAHKMESVSQMDLVDVSKVY